MTEAERELCKAAIAFYNRSRELHEWRAGYRVAPTETSNGPATFCGTVIREQSMLICIVEAEKRLYLAAARVLSDEEGEEV